MDQVSLTSKLNELKETQDKIFNAVLDIKKRLQMEKWKSVKKVLSF